MLNYIYTKETSDINTVCHYYKDYDDNIKAICVKKEINQEQALAMLIEVQDGYAAIIQGLS
jgi:hypothetical protein